MTVEQGRVGWIDASSGVSGDMLLGALSDLGAIEVSGLGPDLGVEGAFAAAAGVSGGLRGVRVTIDPADAQPHRRLAEVLDLVDRAAVADGVRATARATFERLAAAEGRVHGIAPAEVHFHEVGAVDAVIDVVGTCAGVAALGLTRLEVSPIALGGGQVQAAHGTLPVPGPAVLALLEDSHLRAYGGPVEVELATPTGIALLAQLTDATGPMPPMAVERTGIGLGARELPGRSNALRFVVGDGGSRPVGDEDWQLLEANVDDLDPRLWPGVIARLLEVGAGDAWLTPIVMKKGRAAHTISVLVAPTAVDAAARVLFTESTTIGIRTTVVGKRALPRRFVTVDVAGQPVRVKLAELDGQLVNAVPEFDDVASAALLLGRPAKSVLSDAIAAAHRAEVDT
jgi:uncharacterized protein (TIGR00299 family) protein